MTDFDLFREAAKCVLKATCNPYSVQLWRSIGPMSFVSPAWVSVAMFWSALLPRDVSYVLSQSAHVAVVVMLGRRWKWGIVETLLVVLSVPSLANLAEGQIEWLAVVGVLVPGPLGLFLLSSKPQLGGAMIASRLWSWRRMPWRWLPFVLALVAVTIAGAIAFGGPEWGGVLSSQWNLGRVVWPGSALIGAWWMTKKGTSEGRIVAGSILLSPYQTLRTLSWLPCGLSCKGKWIFFVGSWVLVGVVHVLRG